MSILRRSALLAAPMVLALAACAPGASLPVEQGFGPNPVLPEAKKQAVPVVKIAKVVGWAAGETPKAAEGLKVSALASGLDHPRWLYVLPNGDVLVAESNSPERPGDSGGLKGWIASKIMASAGAGTKSPNRITLLRDANGDGVAEVKTTFLSGLNSPFGMSLIGDTLYVANTDAVGLDREIFRIVQGVEKSLLALSSYA